jgi:hypothetical protein
MKTKNSFLAFCATTNKESTAFAFEHANKTKTKKKKKKKENFD